ncbi:hypothetical protein [Halobacteriovorax sp. DA5]|uniref:hypothetical protein n=2 Tax=unclassified Halobacteriovorax TaxID=2639665 RepID=UPI001E60410C|nr:hypothetical protein [Halobacteriovorax sp. DA5]
MKSIMTILFLALAINAFAGTGGISAFTGNNGGVDAGTGGIVGGVDDLKDLKQYDWKTIRKYVKKNYDLELYGDIAYVGRNISVFDVCINNDQIQSISKYPVYKRVWLGGSKESDRYKDIVVGKEILTYPLEVEKEEKICYGRKDRNCRMVKTVHRQNPTPEIALKKEVSRNGRRGDREYKEIFTKKYDIPYCQ